MESQWGYQKHLKVDQRTQRCLCKRFVLYWFVCNFFVIVFCLYVIASILYYFVLICMLYVCVSCSFSLWFYFSSCLITFCLTACFPKKAKRRHGISWMERWMDLIGVGEGEILIRIYCMKKIVFNRKKEKENYLRWLTKYLCEFIKFL